MQYQVTLVESVPETVLQVPWEIRPSPGLLGEDIADGMRELAQITQRAGLTASGVPTITFHQSLPTEEAIVVDFGVPVEPAPHLGPSYGARVVVIPTTLVARTCHRGSYRDLGAAYQALREWMRASGYRPTGPPTEAYLIGPDEVSDPRQLITEVRFPVAPIPAVAVRVDGPFEETMEHTREALRGHGFDVLTEIDVQATLREKLDEHIANYRILAACHPILASRALAADPQAGLLLAMHVVVRSTGTGTLVEAADPALLVLPTAQPALRSVADDTRRLLATVLDTLRASAAAT